MFLLPDQLFVRHWDTYINPQRWRQLFVVQLKYNGSSIGIDGHAVNVMKGTKLETPVRDDGAELPLGEHD